MKSVIDELVEAKKKCKKLVFIHFYDEIFPNLPGWVDEFVKEYGKKIHLPFTIWSHPKMVSPQLLNKLKAVGLTEVIMGIQSGSERVRREVFHRYESQEDILRAVRAIRQAGVWGSFDFMLQHPFETIDDLKASYDLVRQFPSPYELQLHGLNFLPGTDIVDIALEQGLYSKEEMNAILYAGMEEQFGAYWMRGGLPGERGLVPDAAVLAVCTPSPFAPPLGGGPGVSRRRAGPLRRPGRMDEPGAVRVEKGPGGTQTTLDGISKKGRPA